MLNAIASVRLLWSLALVMATLASRKPALAAPNATVLVNAVEAPPLSEIKKAEDGMLSPTPSVSAAEALEKYAYSPTVLRLGFITHAVLAVMLELPAFAALPAVKLNVTEWDERLMVSDSASVAVTAIVCAPELVVPWLPLHTP